MNDGPRSARSHFDWRTLYRRLMTELNWTPTQIGELTPSQVVVLLFERDPSIRRYTTPAENAALAERIAAERKAWER